MSGGGVTPVVTYTWPSDLPGPVLPIAEEFDMPLVESKTEMGVKKTRPKWTEKGHQLQVFYSLLTSAERTTIIDFFDEIGWGGTIFEYPHPLTAEVMDVRLIGKVIFQHHGTSRFDLPLTLERANTG